MQNSTTICLKSWEKNFDEIFAAEGIQIFFLFLILVWTWCKCHSLVFTKFRLSFNWNLDQTWWTCERWNQVKTVLIILAKSTKGNPHGMINKKLGTKFTRLLGFFWLIFVLAVYFNEVLLHSHPTFSILKKSKKRLLFLRYLLWGQVFSTVPSRLEASWIFMAAIWRRRRICFWFN